MKLITHILEFLFKSESSYFDFEFFYLNLKIVTSIIKKIIWVSKLIYLNSKKPVWIFKSIFEFLKVLFEFENWYLNFETCLVELENCYFNCENCYLNMKTLFQF